MRKRRTSRWVVALGSGLVLVAMAGCGSTTNDGDGDAVVGRPAQGVTDETLTIGVRYLKNGDELNQQIGANIKEGDQKAFVETIVDDINAEGGIAGRSVEVVFDARDALSQEPYDQQDQASCAVFTQDHEVLAVVHVMPAEPSYAACLRDRGTALVTAETTGMTQETFEDQPSYATVVGMRLDRAAALQPGVLDDAGYFEGWDASAGAPSGAPVKLGIVTQDTEQYNYAVDTELLPALAEVGVEPEPGHVLRLKVPESEAEVQAAVAELQNSILKLQKDGVSHVMVFEQNGSMTQFFSSMSAEQSYRPRLAVNTGSMAQVGLTLGYITPDHLAGAVGMGWAPRTDLQEKALASGSYDNDAQRHCLDLMRSQGLDVVGTAGNNALGFCDALYFVRDVLADAPAELTTETLMDQIEGYGDGFTSGSVGPTYFSSDQHDGVAQVYTYRFDDSCGCMAYDGPAIPAT